MSGTRTASIYQCRACLLSLLIHIKSEPLFDASQILHHHNTTLKMHSVPPKGHLTITCIQLIQPVWNVPLALLWNTTIYCMHGWVCLHTPSFVQSFTLSLTLYLFLICTRFFWWFCHRLLRQYTGYANSSYKGNYITINLQAKIMVGFIRLEISTKCSFTVSLKPYNCTVLWKEGEKLH